MHRRALIPRFVWMAAAAMALCRVRAQTAPPVPGTASAGSASSEAQSSASEMPAPGAIYQQAMRPLDVVRGSLDNWSDAELGALAVGIHKAREACARMKPENYSGDDLYDLAHLCTFGQDWNAANTAAARYLDSHAEPYRAQAYTLTINALVRLNGVDLAVQTAQAMLRTLPYDAEVAYAVRYLKDYLEQSGNSAALTLASDEHGAVVEALQKGVALKARHGDAVMGYGLLYDSAMQLAFLQQFAGQEDAAAATGADCEDALGIAPALAVEDRQRVQSVQLQFRLLGTKLPELALTRSLQSATAKPQLPPGFGAGTVLVLFPDWCAQCRTMMKALTDFAKINAGTPLLAYGLMFHEESDRMGQTPRDQNFKEFEGTQTFLVPARTAESLGVLDFPTAVVVDSEGVIRFIGVIPTDAFNDGGYVGKVIQRMVAARNRKPPGPKANQKANRIAEHQALDLP